MKEVKAQFTSDEEIQLLTQAAKMPLSSENIIFSIDDKQFKKYLWMLSILPENKFSEYAFSDYMKKTIENLKNLITVLKLLSPKRSKEIFDHFQLENIKINKLKDLLEILEFVPEDKKSNFAFNRTKLITHVDGLIKILKILPEDERIKFIDEIQQLNNLKIESEYNLVEIIECLPKNIRYSYLQSKNELIHINDFSVVVDILNLLPMQDRLLYFRQVQEKIQEISSARLFVDIYNLLPDQLENPDVRSNFFNLMINRITINDSDNLRQILTILPKNACLNFAFKHRDTIKTPSDMLVILSKLPKEKSRRLDFLSVFFTDTATNTELMKRLDKDKNLAINDNLLIDMTLTLPISERLAFIQIIKNHMPIANKLEEGLYSILPSDIKTVLLR